MPVIPAFERLAQEDDEFKVSLGYVASSSQPELPSETSLQKVLNK